MTDIPKSHAVKLARREAYKQKMADLTRQIKIDEDARKADERRKDTRRMILIGRLLTRTLANGDTIQSTKDLTAKLDAYLDKDNDRQLFSLAPVATLPHDHPLLKS